MNTLSTYSNRRKYKMNHFDFVLKNALVAEKICDVDRSEDRYIDNPYGSEPTPTIQALAGTYTVSAWTNTDDGLTVSDEFIIAEHIFDFEKILTKFDIMSARLDAQDYAVAKAIDKFVINNLCEDATGTYTTPAGGFTTPANIPVIIANLESKVAGYEDSYKGLFLVIENTDLVGFLQFQMASGFNYADNALNNGFVGHLASTDIYVIRTGTFVNATLGTTSVTNSGHRVHGVKGVATYAAPRGIQYEEKGVTLKTGKEVVTYGYIGFKLWTVKAALVTDITLA